MSEAGAALVELGQWLRSQSYAFVTVTPESHRRVNARANNRVARSLRDVFGWSRPFAAQELEPHVLELLRTAQALQTEADGLLRSRVRFTTLGGMLLVHSSFPTEDKDSVFLGPDTYRFVTLLSRKVQSARRVVDLGCGTGAGGLSLASRVERVSLTDISARALELAQVNALLADQASAEVSFSDCLQEVQGAFDLVVANPPYLIDEGERTYRDGGGELGTGLAVRIVQEALEKLDRGGEVILYTGTPIVEGTDIFRRALQPSLSSRALSFEYEELDPDVFGEELSRGVYGEVDRIAVVSLVVHKS